MKKPFRVLLVCLTALASLGQTVKKSCRYFEPDDTDPKKWTWMDGDCEIHSRKDLDNLLERHRLWISKYKDDFLARKIDLPVFERGKQFQFFILPEVAKGDPLRANLRGAQLRGVSLKNVDLTGADLSKAAFDWSPLAPAVLSGANLTGADLTWADLSTANLAGAALTGADLAGADVSLANLNGADLSNAHLTGADLHMASLSPARLIGADLTKADLHRAYLVDADLSGANLTEANLAGADLLRSTIYGTDLSASNFTEANLQDTYFEPATLPSLTTIASAEGLDSLRWRENTFLAPHGTGPNELRVLDLRKAFHDAGYREPEAKVNLAYHRRKQVWWQIPIFDWTCAWGADWRRPIWIVLALGAICAFLYWCLLRFGRKRFPDERLAAHSSAIRRRARRRRPSQLFVVASKLGRQRQWPVGRDYSPPKWLYLPRPLRRFWQLRLPWDVPRSISARLRWEMPLFRTAGLLSAMSVLNLGVQGLDLGRWFRLMQRRDFDLKARGTLRLLAGFQSVASFLLLALTVYILLVQPIGE
jgi:uncharacterized protein YjbI with pentapeptide repeats